MSIRRFFFVSLALAVVAVVLHLTALVQLGRTFLRTIISAGLEAGQKQSVMRVVASSPLSRGAISYYLGIAFALGSVVFAVASARRHEPADRSATVALLVCYVMLQFVAL